MDRLQGDAKTVAGVGRPPGLHRDAADVTADLGGKRGAPAAVVPLVDVDLASPVVITFRTHGKVGVAVAVDVPCRGHDKAEGVLDVFSGGYPPGAVAQARCRSVVDADLPGLRVVVARADDQIGVAVAVDVACRCHRPAETVTYAFAFAPAGENGEGNVET